jgi:hypothetical protein
MEAKMNPIDARSHHVPTQLVCRPGCPSQLIPFYQITERPEGDRKALVDQYTTICLAHLAKDGRIKSRFPLKDIHNELASTSLALASSGSSNILLSMVSFGCLITTASGKQVRDRICFSLRIREANTQQKSVFSYEMIVKEYGGKSALYEVIGRLYQEGRSLANPNDCKHGHVPDYSSTTSKHDQYIRHTEQLLAAYLVLPEAANMLAEQLRGRTRAKYPDASALKVYNMGLHMHSTKTCCAPCEYTLLGLMNMHAVLLQNGKHLGFLPNFIQAVAQQNEMLQMRSPKQSQFKLLITVGTSGPDAHHQKQPAYTPQALGKEPMPFHDLSVKSQAISQHIFTTMLNPTYDQRRVPSDPNVDDVTVAISGSRQTSGSAGTIRAVNKTRASGSTPFII